MVLPVSSFSLFLEMYFHFLAYRNCGTELHAGDAFVFPVQVDIDMRHEEQEAFPFMFQYEVHETFIQVGDLYAACRCQQLELFLCREDRIAKGNPQSGSSEKLSASIFISSYTRVSSPFSFAKEKRAFAYREEMFLYPYVTIYKTIPHPTAGR